MGFFDSLFGGKKHTNVEVVPDRIWLTTDAKFAGLAKEAEERSMSETVAILLVAHFFAASAFPRRLSFMLAETDNRD
jgi:hypothetical protein